MFVSCSVRASYNNFKESQVNAALLKTGGKQQFVVNVAQAALASFVSLATVLLIILQKFRLREDHCLH